MFCANCGTKLEDGARFCPNCGALQQTQADVRKPEYPDSYGGGVGARTMGRVIRRFDFDSTGTGMLVGGFIGGIMNMVISIISFAMIEVLDDKIDWLHKLYYSDAYNFARGLLIFFGICMMLSAVWAIVSGIIQKRLYTERFLSINENGISGIGPGTLNLKNVRFEFYYSDIVKVEKLRFGIRVCTNTGKFMIGASKKVENEEIIDIIRSHVGR